MVITEPKKIPQWLANDITYLLPKSDETNNPKNYRPITCLITMLLTSILTEYIYSFLIDSGLFPDEQNRCERGSYGCKDQLLINKMILENCYHRNTKLSIAWIDYKKVFDSVPHSWIEKCLETFKISPVLQNFLSHSMHMWKTTLVLNTGENTLNGGISILTVVYFRGILFLLFCFVLLWYPLANFLIIRIQL